MSSLNYDRVRQGSPPQGESHAMASLKVLMQGQDMVDDLPNLEEDEAAALLSPNEGAGGSETEIDGWALACLLLQHLSK
jgi:hypothetical protein